jgi:hypothetical protein
MNTLWTSLRFGAAATALVSAALISAGSPAQAAPQSPAAAVVSATVAAKPPLPTVRRISCVIRRAKTWSVCTGDNAKVAHSRRVYLALTGPAGHRVQFRIKNRLTGRVLASPVLQVAPDGRAHLYWTNHTAKTVTIDVEARSAALVTTRFTARATLTVK